MTAAPSIQAAPRPLAERIAESASRFRTLAPYPAIADEFERSVARRARMWAPAIEAIAAEGEGAGDTVADVAASWLAMVHLSAPLDQILDADPMSSQWRQLGPIGAFELVLSFKDEVLAAPIERAAGGDATTAARAAIELAAASLTAAIGSYFDIGGRLSWHRGADPARLALLYDRIVEWKCGVIYRALTECVAVAAGVPAAARRAFAAFGLHTGVAVQVLDDAGGVFGPGEGDLDKDPVKITFPLAYALNSSQGSRAELAELLATPRSARDLGRVRELLDAIDTRRFLEYLVEERRDRCDAALAPVAPRTRRSLLDWYDDYFRRRVPA
jgi:geranylgeranyl diphosphate synthase type I